MIYEQLLPGIELSKRNGDSYLEGAETLVKDGLFHPARALAINALEEYGKCIGLIRKYQEGEVVSESSWEKKYENHEWKLRQTNHEYIKEIGYKGYRTISVKPDNIEAAFDRKNRIHEGDSVSGFASFDVDKRFRSMYVGYDFRTQIWEDPFDCKEEKKVLPWIGKAHVVKNTIEKKLETLNQQE